MNHVALRHQRDTAADPGWGLIRLRRDGQPPLRFVGRLIDRHQAPVDGDTLQHDLALYLTAAPGFAVEIVARAARGDRSYPVRCHADLFDTLDGALTRLETHDPSRDICPGLSAPAPAFTDPAVSPARLALQAAALQSACQDISRRYGVAVGALLARIALSDDVSLRIQS